MIERNQKELRARYYGTRGIARVYYGTLLVWEAVASCFSGAWRNPKKWDSSSQYKNNI